MEWTTYLTKGPGELLYHMCITTEWDSQIKEFGHYAPPTYGADGFIHATAEPEFLLGVANHFYKESVGDWICLRIDPNSLGSSKVVYEAPAPVGNIEAYDHEEKEGEQPKFPHIYGPILKDSVIGKEKIVRAKDGSFLSIDNIC